MSIHAVPLWVGTHPPDGLGTPVGKGEGVWRAQMKGDGSLTAEQVAVMPAPSFVAAHPTLPLVYAVCEDVPAALHVISADSPFAVLSTVDLGGADACHVLLAPGERTLYITLYASGELVVVRLAPDGLPEGDNPQQRFAYQGSGPRADRQEAAHAHQAVVAPGGNHVVVCDLGSDTLWAHERREDGSLGPPTVATRFPPGSGPRHAAVHGEHLYVVCEIDHHLRTVRWDRASGTGEIVAEQPTTLAAQRTGEDVFDAHVTVVAGPTGHVLLASVRGPDVIAVFDLAPEGEARYRAAFDSGHWPRHFAVVTDAEGNEHVVVAAGRGHELRSFAVQDILALPPETEAGAIATLAHASAAVTSPACIAAVLGT